MRYRLALFGAIIGILATPPPTWGQDSEPWLDPGQIPHWTIKATASVATDVALNALDVGDDASALLAALAPSVVGKAIYAPKGLGDVGGEAWPSVGFVLRDIAGELCVQSGPLWYNLAESGDEWWRMPAAAVGYAASVLVCARRFEVR